MIILANGRGQLGESLKEKLKNFRSLETVYIYHTWNVWEKDALSQENEYDKFCNFVDKNKKKGKIVFISTYSNSDNNYVFYKQKAEAFLILNCDSCLVLRLPHLIGNKGIFSKLKTKTAEPYGSIEIMSLEDAANKILNYSRYSGLCKSFTFKGEKINTTTLNEIIHAFNGEEK